MIFISEINLGAVYIYFPSLKSQYFVLLSFGIGGEIGHQAERETVVWGDCKQQSWD